MAGRAFIAYSSLFFVSACATLPSYDDNAVAQFSEVSQKTLAEINRCNVNWLNRAPSGSMLLIKNGYVYRHDTNTALKLSDEGSVRTLKGYYRSGLSVRIFDTRNEFIQKAKDCMK
jgi:hypothetical protein